MSLKRREMEELAAYREQLCRKPRLVYLFLELTGRCNMDCLHCGSGCGRDSGGFLDFDKVIPVLEEVKRAYTASTVMICLTGGEPLLHPEFERIVRTIHAMGFPWGITTNGLLIDPPMADLFRACDLPIVALSLDGLEATHDWFRRSPGSYRQVLDRIELLHSKGLQVQVTTVVHRRNLGELEELCAVLEKLGVESWRPINLEPIGRARSLTGLLLSPEEYAALFRFIRGKRARPSAGMEVTSGCSHYLGEAWEREIRDHYFFCGAGLYVASILWNGDIFACLDIERRPELVQGNIETDCFVDVWENRFAFFRRDRTASCARCAACEDRRLCAGDSAHTWNFDENRPNLCLLGADTPVPQNTGSRWLSGKKLNLNAGRYDSIEAGTGKRRQVMLQIASYTDIGGRPANEDTVRQVLRGEDALCLVVADGLGGHGGGAMASAAAAEAICGGWDGSASPQGLEKLVQRAHRAVRAIQTPACAMKSTVVALEISGSKAVWAHVGDSRLYHFQDGKQVFQTRDHSVSQIAVFMGEITTDEIRFHEDRSRVLRALGQADDPLTVETADRELAPGKHAFLLCSDGFWEYVLESEMAADLAQARDPADWLEKMRSRLSARAPQDNDNNTAAAVWAEVR